MLLITMLIVGAAGLIIGISVSMSGVGELDMGFSSNQSAEALAIADGCTQDALFRLMRDRSYNGGSLTIGDGSCTITIATVGQQKTITVVASLGKWQRTLEVDVDMATNPLTILDWSEVAN